MSMKDVGIYLRVLREEFVGGRGALARQLQTDDSQIERVEKGQDTRGSFLFALARAVQADIHDIDYLLTLEDDVISEEVARACALERIKRIRISPPEEQNERRRQADDLVEQLISQPRKLDLWLGYGLRLLEETSDIS
jgi:hypothetical protein